jgi:curli biogenesis system outer membrane secretion channel CsgG
MNKLVAFGLVSCMLAINCYLPEVNAAEGNLRYTINVEKFKNDAGWHGRWDLGDGFGAIMTEALNASEQFIVLGETGMRNAAMQEQDLAAGGRTAGGKKAPKIGRMTPAQLKVKGSITHVQEQTSGGKGGISLKESASEAAKDMQKSI